MSDWTAGKAMGTLTRLHATAALTPSGWGGLEEEGEKQSQAKVLLREEHCVLLHGWLWHPVGDRAGVRGPRAPFGTTKRNGRAGQLQEGAHAHGETGTYARKCSSDSGEGEMEGELVTQRVREPGTARYSRQPAPPLGTHRA